MSPAEMAYCLGVVGSQTRLSALATAWLLGGCPADPVATELVIVVDTDCEEAPP